eukprot:3403126-Amphidinium_carterae.2
MPCLASSAPLATSCCNLAARATTLLSKRGIPKQQWHPLHSALLQPFAQTRHLGMQMDACLPIRSKPFVKPETQSVLGPASPA